MLIVWSRQLKEHTGRLPLRQLLNDGVNLFNLQTLLGLQFKRQIGQIRNRRRESCEHKSINLTLGTLTTKNV